MDENLDLEIPALASVGGLAAWRNKHTSKVGSPCANCGTPLEGPYCHACGQLAEDFERSIVSLFLEAVENFFHTDGRVFHTVPRLVLRPAALTRDYLAGKRASQMPPVRMFLVVVVVYFLAGSLREFGETTHVEVRPLPKSDVAFIGDSNLKAIAAWALPRARYAAAHPKEFSVVWETWLHRMAILFLPISTLLLGLLFVFNRRFYLFDHAIFSMHSLSFMGLLFTVITLAGAWPPLGAVVFLLSLAAPVHLFIHMRGVYRTSVPGTLLRMALLFLLSCAAAGLLLLGVVGVGLTAMDAA